MNRFDLNHVHLFHLQIFPNFLKTFSRYIFWADRGYSPKIERCNLDGSDRQTIVSTELSWPAGLAVDHIRGWLYFSDSKKKTIEVVKYDGSQRQKIYNAQMCKYFVYLQSKHVFSFTQFFECDYLTIISMLFSTDEN